MTESTLLDYIRFQADQCPRPAPASINRRVSIAERVLRLEVPGAVAQSVPDFQRWYWRRAPLGFGRWRPALSQLRVRTPKRTIEPLSVDQVARFWCSFRTSRDLAIIGLTVLTGLRSREVLALNVDDLLVSDSQIPVPGKATKCAYYRCRLRPHNSWTTICIWSGPHTAARLCLFLSRDARAEDA